MIFVLDVGNTNIVLGVFKNGELHKHWRIGTSQQKTEDEYAMIIKELFRSENIVFNDIKGIIISSVVPPIMSSLELMCKKYFHVDPLIIGPGIKTGLDIKYENPREVGADRIVNAVAAIDMYDCPLIIVDFGTATTFCYVNEKKHYMGGVIAPGIKISTEALFTYAAKLPRIEITKPDMVIGRNTVSAMQSGIFYGYVGQVEGIVNGIKKQFNTDPKIIATGGLASLIAQGTDIIDHVDPFLTLKGLYLIFVKNH
ncbi:type III pantothenate kinase [Pueribacillus theae]|uniref:Type III pantothenate kinase n=1 Tax=Pueribacillus theae TaxID=2171751 RepID=A0A2U1K3Q3_9BACI|nr:type III pantothenate kinase [Pueribacillus theae]PWA12141.1 type III pantothenate kinase [Pueribacillus theae]